MYRLRSSQNQIQEENFLSKRNQNCQHEYSAELFVSLSAKMIYIASSYDTKY